MPRSTSPASAPARAECSYIADRTAETDADGRFRLSPMPGDRAHVWAAAPDGQPYLTPARRLAWPKGATEQAVDLALPRGVLIRGKVTEEGTGQPVADAIVSFRPYAQRAARAGGSGWARTKADGSFAFAVAPHSGHLSVQAPGEDYQLQAIGSAQFYGGNRRGGSRLYAHAFLPCDPRPGTEAPEIRVALRRGATVKVRLIGPDGQPARDVSRLQPSRPGADGRVRGPDVGRLRVEVARHGHFEVHGLDPETEVPVHFLQPDRKLGATARLSGKMAAQGPVTVRLEPCGTAMARLVGPDGKPVAGQPRSVSVMMVVTPGPPAYSAEVRAGALAADEDSAGPGRPGQPRQRVDRRRPGAGRMAGPDPGRDLSDDRPPRRRPHVAPVAPGIRRRARGGRRAGGCSHRGPEALIK